MKEARQVITTLGRPSTSTFTRSGDRSMQTNSTINEPAPKAPLAEVIQFRRRPSIWRDPEQYETLFERHLSDEKNLNLQQFLFPQVASTFFIHVTDDCMRDVGIFAHDLLIVDSSYKCTDGDIVVGWLNGELLLGTLRPKNGRTFINYANDDFAPTEISDSDEFHLGGLVTFAIHPVADRLNQAF
jgi:phage repressor protein C with HTH and peptisase S24 domain